MTDGTSCTNIACFLDPLVLCVKRKNCVFCKIVKQVTKDQKDTYLTEEDDFSKNQNKIKTKGEFNENLDYSRRRIYFFY